MKAGILTILCIFFSINLHAQSLQSISGKELETMLQPESEALIVINFWATWCSPCVAEIPHFERIMKDYSRKEVEFYFISLDFKSGVESSLIPFLEKREIKPWVLWMNDIDYNTWMPYVNEEWKGNIPATLFLKKEAKGTRRIFHPEALEYEDLKNIIESII